MSEGVKAIDPKVRETADRLKLIIGVRRGLRNKAICAREVEQAKKMLAHAEEDLDRVERALRDAIPAWEAMTGERISPEQLLAATDLVEQEGF